MRTLEGLLHHVSLKRVLTLLSALKIFRFNLLLFVSICHYYLVLLSVWSHFQSTAKSTLNFPCIDLRKMSLFPHSVVLEVDRMPSQIGSKYILISFDVTNKCITLPGYIGKKPLSCYEWPVHPPLHDFCCWTDLIQYV